MDLQETMSRLSELGTEQNRKIYRRHGKVDPLFGVSYANLNLLKKEIKKDQSLAESLWETGNHDARILSTMIADPKAIRKDVVLAWASGIENYMQSDALSQMVAKTPFWKEAMYDMISSEYEFVKACGYSILSSALKEEREVPDQELQDLLARIEDDIHSSPNRARYSMNGAVISIGVFRPDLADLAIESGARIGHVEVDHGQTGCETPDIVKYIEKVSNKSK